MSIDVVKFLREEAAEWDHIEHIGDAIVEIANKLDKRIETEYVGPLYRTDYFVHGRGAFPIDMLRYVQSWPAAEDQAHAIDCSLREAGLGIEDPHTVKLTKYHRDPKPVLSEDRWWSKFHWKIVGAIETTEL